MDTNQVDLRGLAVQREPSTELPGPPVRWFSRYLFPAGLLFGLLGLLTFSVGDQLLPVTPVKVINVVVKQADTSVAGAPLFQAPGWVEPRPTLVNITALTEGIIDQLFVVEGDYISKGQMIARLITADMDLEREQAENLIAIRQSELDRSKAERDGLEMKFKFPVHLETNLAEAKSQLAKTKTLRGQVPFLIQSMEAKVKYALQNWEGKQASQGAVAQRLIVQAEQEYHSLMAELTELRQRGDYLDQEISALQERKTALQRQLELRVDELRLWNEAKARVDAAQSLLQEAHLQRKQTELRRSRAEIAAPMDGRILRLKAAPGSSVSDAGIHGNSTIAEMYDPQNLQVRADVRLEDVPKITSGQPVEIRTASFDQPIEAIVSHLTSVANVQRNTLEVKVTLLNPPDTVKPEMLVTATFLAPSLDSAIIENEPESAQAIFVPISLIVDREGSQAIWIVSHDRRSQLQPIETGNKYSAELIEIKSGLRLTDKLIASGTEQLKSGQRIRVSQFD